MKNLFAFMAILGLIGIFSACSSDDKNDPVPPSIKYEGVYKGDIDVSFNGLELQVEDKIEIIKTDENLATLQLKDFSFEGIKIGDIIIENVKVTSKNKTAELIGQAPMDLVVGDCLVLVNATVTGDNLKATIDVEVTPPLNEDGTQEEKMTIKVTFNGVRTEYIASSEAEILTFGLKDISLISSEIENEIITLSIYNTEVADLESAMPVVTLSAGATISPSLDIAQNFTEAIEYVVTSEDKLTQVTYKVLVNIVKVPNVIKFDFSSAVTKYTNDNSSNDSSIPVAKDAFVWDSSDAGLNSILSMYPKLASKYGVTHVDNDEDFKAPVFRIETLNTVGNPSFLGFPAIPKITSGSLFLGSFKLDTRNPLKSTRFGVPIESKPLKVSGTINYKSGDAYYECPNPTPTKSNIANLVEGKKDEGLISAVVYEVENNTKTLDGTNIYTSTNVIVGMAKAIFLDGQSGDFTFDIEYTKAFDPTKAYKLAIILSSSKDGDKFSGAGGSVLKVSKLEVEFD